MPILESRRPMTEEQIMNKARPIAYNLFKHLGLNLYFAITQCADNATVLVWAAHSPPNPCIGKIGEYIPDAVICPWCEINLIGKHHKLTCDRPSLIYSHEECDPHYDSRDRES